MTSTLVRPVPVVSTRPAAHVRLAPRAWLALHGRYGHAPATFATLTEGVRALTLPGVPGALPYTPVGRVWLAAGDPLAPPACWGEFARAFLSAARAAHVTPALAGGSAAFAQAAVREGWRAVRFGATPYLDARTWSPRGHAGRTLRNNLNRARRAGVEVSAVPCPDAPTWAEIDALSAAWLSARSGGRALGWVLALTPRQHASHRRFFVARRSDGPLLAFLACSPLPAREGWYLEDVVRAPDAPGGTAALLVHDAILALREAGARTVTLGCAPLADVALPDETFARALHLERAARQLGPLLAHAYNCGGLRRFKAQFAGARWEGEYVLLAPGLLSTAATLPALARALWGRRL
ncbi:DUF2156 domain-containing protein (plasmid) [Deinococcus metallilatus]|uniref:Lysylphosphatidylglycerol synthetase-like protein (DUF2156 family) n=1 Tax=Deinococcus metallilatus TaxID=1211322 RepID=A0ABR6MV05_9DEIO|nr:DUF2156 domain-containing protein [Deinococcus metallilatus]MBB5295760.1 lysylphosphatidylglycerol synthetase-like protein (DUF2156 family) [Deinococcus metallilatus]QBY06799.1 DUF2156 domain-containing protein [Deinococcus metallilatus]GMA14289.1 hypothetical protein GCM10025871_06200 [Deinococcus metallilatus]